MKYVYSFKEGNKDLKNILGGKGANLAEMCSLGLPVPDGFTITTEACNKYYENNKVLDEEIEKEIFNHLEVLEKNTKKTFGGLENPLLVSVRSGARSSMPGMMDTVLNLGLNDDVCKCLIEKTNNKRFVYDSYRRLIMMFADVVMGYSKSNFERRLDEIKINKGVKTDLELTGDDMLEITNIFKGIYKDLANTDFPQDPKTQLIEAVKAVFRSWNNERAIYYRKINNIPDNWGTAVNVQEMVYGNLGETSGTGVAFTRNPATGEKKLFGEYLINAQGEDVVAGVRTPQPIETLKEIMPNVYAEFEKYCQILENHYKDMQDMEFTIENSKLYMLQTRNGKRTGLAAINIAVDLVKNNVITKEEAIMRVEANQLEQLLHKTFNKEELEKASIITKGLAASPGAGSGKICFNAKDAILKGKNGEDVILVRLETSPEDIEGMQYSKAVLTVRGGMTSHAAVVARGMGICCVSGCGELIVDEETKTLITPNGKKYSESDEISVDGTSGIIYDGKIATEEPSITGAFEEFMNWVDEIKQLKVRCNADTKKDALIAKKFGAEGIGLCRTEHMFFDKERIFNLRKMILSTTKEQREEALNKILPYQQNDFEELYKVMEGKSVVIRYLDPPLHEFLPKKDEEIKELANVLNLTEQEILNKISELKEFNPMMGHRGCRLDVTYPEIAIMQTKAVIGAAINVKKQGIDVTPEIMIPLVGDLEELKYVKNLICQEADKLIKENNINLKYEVGSMIEIPRAAIIADELAKECDFFSFGTNDLTQLTYGFSRDDASKFLNDYYDKKIFKNDPFVSIDQEGVGKLVDVASKLARKVKKNISLGICGEHAGDEASIEFFHKVGLDYVSASPYRIPVARLSSAKAAIKNKR